MAEWRNIEEFNGMYQVSDDGQVKNANSGVILHQYRAGSTIKYPVVVLYTGPAKVRGNKSKYVRRYVHRLVAGAFIPNPHEKPEVNHIDSNPLNNTVENLEWVTHSENMRHANERGNRAKFKRRVIRDDGVEYGSIAEAAVAMDYEVGNMHSACKNGWRVRGYGFAFADEVARDFQIHGPRRLRAVGEGA